MRKCALAGTYYQFGMGLRWSVADQEMRSSRNLLGLGEGGAKSVADQEMRSSRNYHMQRELIFCERSRSGNAL